jgi:hypothetical protein
MNRTEQALDRSGISIAPPMRPRAVTQTIAPAPTQAPSTRAHKQEPNGSETESSDSESSLYDQQMEVDNLQLGDTEMGRVGYDAMGEAVGDGDGGDYGEGDQGMGYDENIDDGASQQVPVSLFSLGGDHANWPGDVGYDQHMVNPPTMGQYSDTGALWKSQHGGGAHYRAAADELSSSRLQVPENAGFHRSKDDHAIPLNPDAIVKHFDTPRKPKRGRGRADSVESRQSKVNRRSASHSTAAQSTMVSTGAQSPSSAIPSTKVSTRPQSPNHSVSPVGQDFQGASRATGGVIRGRALGNTANWADSKYSNAHMGIASSKPNGKVLLYTSRDQEAHPAMMIMHETVAHLPPILQKLSCKFSPI